MLTIQCHLLLRKLRHIQGTEDNRLFINVGECTVQRESDAVEFALPAYSGKLHSMLLWLAMEHMVDTEIDNYLTAGQCRVTHAGFHSTEVRAFNLLLFLGKSVAVPIVVAFVTAFLTTRFLSGAPPQ